MLGFPSSKDGTTDHFFLKIKGILLNISVMVHIDDRKQNFKEKKNYPQIYAFSPFSKGQKLTSKFKKKKFGMSTTTF